MQAWFEITSLFVPADEIEQETDYDEDSGNSK